jgi:hypothetical protein
MIFDKRGYVREYVTPANPQTVNQANSRQRVADVQAAAKVIGPTALAAIKAASPTGYRWNSNLIKIAIGTGSALFTAHLATYTGLTAPQQATWDASFIAVIPPVVPGTPTVPHNAGAAAFVLCSALYAEGIITAPGAPGAANSAAWETAVTA